MSVFAVAFPATCADLLLSFCCVCGLPLLQTSLLCHMFPGSVFGSELRARKWE